MWRVAESAWLYIRVDAPRAGNALAAFAVADLDAALADLHNRDIRPSLLEEFEAGRKVTLLDRREPGGDHPGALRRFSQTETWVRLSLVNRARSHPSQRSTSTIPARRPMRSSSAGQT